MPHTPIHFTPAPGPKNTHVTCKRIVIMCAQPALFTRVQEANPRNYHYKGNNELFEGIFQLRHQIFLVATFKPNITLHMPQLAHCGSQDALLDIFLL